MSKVIDKDEVLALLKRAVEAKGADYIDPAADSYEGCKYSIDDGPSCIVGHVFDYAGLDLTKLVNGSVKGDVLASNGYVGDDKWTEFDTYRLSPSFYDGADLQEPEYEFTHVAVQALSVAQSAQDSGKTWGEAYDRALEA